MRDIGESRGALLCKWQHFIFLWDEMIISAFFILIVVSLNLNSKNEIFFGIEMKQVWVCCLLFELYHTDFKDTEKVWRIVNSLHFQVSSNNWSLKIENKNIIWCHSASQQLIFPKGGRDFHTRYTLSKPSASERQNASDKWLSCKPIQQHASEASPTAQMFPSSIPPCHLSKPCSGGNLSRKQTLLSSPIPFGGAKRITIQRVL